jgi:hypothetical protein
MDSWTHSNILSMLEGGNQQLSNFFTRHALPAPGGSDCRITNTGKDRYKTNAALFYRRNLNVHVETVKEAGAYSGRRRKKKGAGSGGGTRRSPKRKEVQHEMSKAVEAKA